MLDVLDRLRPTRPFDDPMGLYEMLLVIVIFKFQTVHRHCVLSTGTSLRFGKRWI